MKPILIDTPKAHAEFLDEFMETPEWEQVHEHIYDDTQYMYVKLDEDPKGLRLWFGKQKQLKKVWDVDGDGDDFSIYAVFALPHTMNVITLNLNMEDA